MTPFAFFVHNKTMLNGSFYLNIPNWSTVYFFLGVSIC